MNPEAKRRWGRLRKGPFVYPDSEEAPEYHLLARQ